MGDFKKRGSFGGNGRSGGGFKSRESGGSSSFGGGRSRFARPGNREFRDSQMFSATCAECQKSCEVPFRPTGDKPVYCSYCFSKNKNDGSNDYPRRDRETPSNDFPRKSFSADRAPKPQFDNSQVNDLKKQVETISNKLDKIMELLKKTEVEEVKEKKIDVKALSAVVKKVVATPKKEEKKVAKKKTPLKKK